MTRFTNLIAGFCPGCCNPYQWGSPHHCVLTDGHPGDKPTRPISDEDVDRIARRVAELIKAEHRWTEQ